MSSTHRSQPTTIESPPRPIPENDGQEIDTRAPPTFDTGCPRRLACLIDAENQSISPAHGVRRE